MFCLYVGLCFFHEALVLLRSLDLSSFCLCLHTSEVTVNDLQHAHHAPTTGLHSFVCFHLWHLHDFRHLDQSFTAVELLQDCHCLLKCHLCCLCIGNGSLVLRFLSSTHFCCLLHVCSELCLLLCKQRDFF